MAPAAGVSYRLARHSRRSLVDVLPFSAIAGCGRASRDCRCAGVAGKPLAFNRDIRPILSDKCFRCHGPDAAHRQAGLRLDRREDAVHETGTCRPIAPGKPEHSEVYRRITADDPSERMPPADSGLNPLGRRDRAAAAVDRVGRRVPAALVVHRAAG